MRRPSADSASHDSGRRVWTIASLPKMSRGKLTPLVATSMLSGILGRETQHVRGPGSCRENPLLPNGQGSDLSHVWPAEPEGRLPWPVVEAPCQPLDFRPWRVSRDSACATAMIGILSKSANRQIRSPPDSIL